MKGTVIIALILVAQPAEAEACHRFSKWYYPYPQKCSVSSKQVKMAAFVPDVLPPVRFVDESPEPRPVEEVEVIVPKVDPPSMTLPPLESWENVQHEAGIMKLRMQLNGWKDK